MPKTKPKSVLMTADGSGGMVKVEDRRFEKGAWPISFDVPTERDQADRWLRYLRAECNRRGWSPVSLGQLERAENSGSITVMAAGSPTVDIVWERKRGGPLKVRARPASSSTVPLSEARQFFEQINDHCGSGRTDPIYARGTLQYEGMAWRGELWLDDKVRLAPPSLQDETATLGPRIVHVDAVLDCIGDPDVPYVRNQTLREVSAFLSVVMRDAVRLPDQGRTWTWTFGTTGCEVRQLGYMEIANPLSMPVRRTDKSISLYPVDNPPIGLDRNEISLRKDVTDLWNLYRGLGLEQRRQFLQAAAKWQEAMIHWQDRPSLSFALMVVACEALKPRDANIRHNCYHVIEALLGRAAADRLRQHAFPAQKVRSAHLHTGEFLGSEFVEMAFMSSYEDPSFREAHRELAQLTPAAIIEWLKCGGTFNLPAIAQRRTVQRWIKDNVFVAFAFVFGTGLLIGWLLETFWRT